MVDYNSYNLYDTLVLSGNSTNIISTMGALQKLFDKKILIKSQIKSFYGTSSGAMLCALTALGFEPIDILAYICANKSYSKISGFNFTSGGIINFDLIENELENIIISKLGYIPTMECVKTKLDKKLVFITYNLTTGIKNLISYQTYPGLPVTKALRMSSNFPFVFPPYEFEGSYYLDGGIVENFPMYTAQLAENKCFGLYNNNPVKPYSLKTNYIELFFRLITVFMSSSADNIQCKEGSYILKLSYEPSFFNFTSSNYELINMFDKGYETCSKELKI